MFIFPWPFPDDEYYIRYPDQVNISNVGSHHVPHDSLLISFVALRHMKYECVKRSVASRWAAFGGCRLLPSGSSNGPTNTDRGQKWH
jgi:hypothetical protein